MLLPTGKRDFLMRALDKSGCNRLLKMAGTWNGLLVLNYHRIGEPADSLFDAGLWSASEENFDRQVHYVADNFDVIGLDDLGDVLRPPGGGSPRSGRHVLITFDDGYRDNYDAAFPILRTHGATAAFFPVTGFLDRPQVSWWDEIAWIVRTSPRNSIEANPWTIRPIDFDEPHRLKATQCLSSTYKQLEGSETENYLAFLADATESGRCPDSLAAETWMTWDMVREMRGAGMSFGGHTVNHPILSNLPAEEQDAEICECRLRLEHELGEQITAFSYPVGDRMAFTEVTRRCLEKYGFRWAFSYYGDYCRAGDWCPLDIPRTAIESDVDFAAFRSVAALPQLFA